MTVYDATFSIPAAFKPQSYENTLGEYLAKNGKKQGKPECGRRTVFPCKGVPAHVTPEILV